MLFYYYLFFFFTLISNSEALIKKRNNTSLCILKNSCKRHFVFRLFGLTLILKSKNIFIIAVQSMFYDILLKLSERELQYIYTRTSIFSHNFIFFFLYTFLTLSSYLSNSFAKYLQNNFC